MFFAVSKQFNFMRSLSFIHLLQLVLMSVLLKSCLAHLLPFPPSDSGCQASCCGPWSIWSCFVQVRNLTLFFTDNYGVWPAPFVKVAVFSLMCIFGLLVKKKNRRAVGAWVCLYGCLNNMYHIVLGIWMHGPQLVTCLGGVGGVVQLEEISHQR